MIKNTIFKICTGPSCTKNFSQYIWERAILVSKQLVGTTVETCGCQGRCEDGPTVLVESSGHKKYLQKMDPIKIAKVMKTVGKH